MNPFYFGTGRRRLFGIYEPPRAASQGLRAAVLCHPWGAEYLHAHRTMRQLAIRLSAAGYHTLRFDYFGTGDSAGDVAEADLKGWEADIETAIGEVRDTSGASRVALVGLRLGATLAASVAERRSEDIDALVLWDPVVSGSEYLARLLAASATATPHGPAGVTSRSGGPGGREILGFLLTDIVAREIEAIDLTTWAPRLPQRSLVIVSEALDSHATLRRALAGRTFEQVTSIAPWIENPNSAGVLSVDVLQAGRGVAGVIEQISETAVLLGQQKAMVGIVTQPVATELRADRPAILILNTGIIHRVGHNRMYVNLSRALAQVGYVVLRFDLSGIGDSESRGDGLQPLDAALADIRDAIDWLEGARQAEKVIICGLCSGADHAVLYGYTDPRVVGLVLMDPSIPPTARYYLGYIRRRLMRLRSWANVALGRSISARRWLKDVAIAFGFKAPPGTPRLSDRKVRQYLERVYQESIAHGIQFLVVFTAVEDTRQNYREQLFDAFPNLTFGDQLRLEFFEQANHTFMS